MWVYFLWQLHQWTNKSQMSISPSSRDLCLAACVYLPSKQRLYGWFPRSHRGLFILDLESPLEVPRFLPQGGTWDVADVQWNPHPQRDRFIVSTSSEKLCACFVFTPHNQSYICDHLVSYGTFFLSEKLLLPTFSSRIAVLSRTSIGTRQNATLLQALELIHGSMLGT